MHRKNGDESIDCECTVRDDYEMAVKLFCWSAIQRWTEEEKGLRSRHISSND